ncbi:hypothetical protein RI129_004765 [Pyrocoelia pectoralis]|uniref:DUF3421 domain-containing protein n=1 Tax=Pyrocoelia pectoralis TaxID=417401 RepID=A0AAN7VIT9_9COLE
MGTKRLLLIICINFVLPASASGPCNKPSLGYYWRDYVGEIPYDAVPGGKDKSGLPTFIGQAYIKGFELLPATINAGSPTAIASAYNIMMPVNKNIKILCSNELEKFSWLVTKSEEAHLITNCHLVVGGSEVDQTLHIGRVNHDGQTVIGKVFSYRPGGKGLWIPYGGHEIHYTSYEILTYNCNRK